MNEILKVSDITYEDVAKYLRLGSPTNVEDYELPNDEIKLLNNLINISKQFIIGYTGHTEEELDNYADFVIVVFVLCQDMYDNRTLYVDKTNLNKVVECSLGMHCINLL